MKRPKFVNHQIYHVYNRGVEKREIFCDDNDYYRFIHNLFEFNDINLADKFSEIRSQKIEPERKPRKFLVNILVFCLMPNHFHLLLEQKQENGISEFLRKLGVGYAMYFNQKYERVGSLFQGRFKAVLVDSESHFIHLPYYIHLNPLDLIIPEWRERKIKDYRKAIQFLESYRWSSYVDYIGKRNFPSVTQRGFLMKYFNSPKEYKENIINWLEETSMDDIKDITID